jgi:CSLREA domain-containing protein
MWRHLAPATIAASNARVGHEAGEDRMSSDDETTAPRQGTTMSKGRRAALAAVALASALTGVPVATAATITVTPGAVDTTTNRNCSLREAITAANTDAAVDACTRGSGDDTLRAGGTFILTVADNGANGLPVITSPIAIGNATITRDSRAPAFRIFEVASGGSLSLTRATVRGGLAADCPQAPGVGICGGGIDNLGTLNVSNSRIADNTAAGNPPAAPDFTYVEGGGIENDGTANVVNSDVTGNSASITADGGGGGGGGINNNATLTVQNSRVAGNTVTAAGNAQEGVGGAITTFGPLTVTSSQLVDNSASCSAVDCLAAGGAISSNGFFGAFNVNVTGSQVTHNTVSCTGSCVSAIGGGILNGNDSTLTMSRSQVADNTVSCSAASCSVARGGGLYNRGAQLTMTSSYAVANVVSCPASSCIARGGAMFTRSADTPGTATLTSSIVIGNRVIGTTAEGGGIFRDSGTVTLDHSLVAANRPNNCRPLASVLGCYD